MYIQRKVYKTFVDFFLNTHFSLFFTELCVLRQTERAELNYIAPQLHNHNHAPITDIAFTLVTKKKKQNWRRRRRSVSTIRTREYCSQLLYTLSTVSMEQQLSWFRFQYLATLFIPLVVAAITFIIALMCFDLILLWLSAFLLYVSFLFAWCWFVPIFGFWTRFLAINCYPPRHTLTI